VEAVTRAIVAHDVARALVAAHADAVERRLDLIATVLLALATVATAWAAYQARQWTGEQSQGYSHATAARITVNRTSAVANRQVQIDVATFIAWVDARAQGRQRLANFYEARFRPEFRPAFDAWLAAKPLTNAQAPKTPFELPQYRLAATEQADALEAKAAAFSEEAKDANQRADNYTLAVVLFASALFFAGLSLRLDSLNARIVLLGLGAVLFLGTAVWLFTMPTRITV
jgi:hypothetical protein